MANPTLAVFGGSFNPPHLAHQMLISAALAMPDISEVWMIPTYRHAFGKHLAPYRDRVNMCERIAAPLGERVVVSRLESELGGESRTLPLLQRLIECLPRAQFRLLIGADILAEADNWYRWDEVIRLAPPLVFGRVGSSLTRSPSTTVTLPNISSTEIRRRLATGKSVATLLPDAVVHYIVTNQLYGVGSSVKRD